ncbi:hypothetical protein [Mycolicibacterium confluentis]|uniref:Uncharacterized protein n=1 Tax=Mycolicibacterium confluentis TaxID=28047 RepID=A0A7I7XY33_9MYCO|nr:hypothetical protein [Mycolicibacterium confluentis]MCV7318396.1 hypothetical protein [Mycolicibacterium confluentis]ORV20229.1 hypothetical protein AWB99_07195 [Mycolicibacterium confluentis]BBZ34064.1 hypothetical protein MCNF_26690 [Mycolicibacterium confluentis]
MIDDEDRDAHDPIQAAFDDYRSAPRDIVPRRVEHSLDDLRLLADGTAQVTVTHYEYNEHGVTAHSECVGITAPFIKSEREHQ